MSERGVVVAAAIVNDLLAPAQVLSARRIEPPTLAGGWEFPGGKVEPGETLEQALRREIAEELSVEIELGDSLTGPLRGPGIDGAWPLGSRWAMFVRLATVVRGDLVPVDHDRIAWLTAADLYSVPWLPDDLPIVHALERRLRR